jgi:hypothetical protein
MKLIATELLKHYAGKALTPGQEFEAEDKDVYVLKLGKFAIDPPRQPRQYKRRDMTAER